MEKEKFGLEEETDNFDEVVEAGMIWTEWIDWDDEERPPQLLNEEVREAGLRSNTVEDVGIGADRNAAVLDSGSNLGGSGEEIVKTNRAVDSKAEAEEGVAAGDDTDCLGIAAGSSLDWKDRHSLSPSWHRCRDSWDPLRSAPSLIHLCLVPASSARTPSLARPGTTPRLHSEPGIPNAFHHSSGSITPSFGFIQSSKRLPLSKRRVFEALSTGRCRLAPAVERKTAPVSPRTPSARWPPPHQQMRSIVHRQRPYRSRQLASFCSTVSQTRFPLTIEKPWTRSLQSFTTSRTIRSLPRSPGLL